MTQAQPQADSAGDTDVSNWGHVQQVAALIVQRAFLRSRLQKAQVREQEVQEIAERLSQAGAGLLGGRSGAPVQESGPRTRRSTRPDGSDVAWAPVLARSQSKGTVFKRASKSKLARRLATMQIYRKLRSVAAPPCQSSLQGADDDTKGLDTVSDPGSPPARCSSTRFSRASAEHQLTPYRPRSSSSPRRRSRMPPDALLNRVDATLMPGFPLDSQALGDVQGTEGGMPSLGAKPLQYDTPTQGSLRHSEGKQLPVQATSDLQSRELTPARRFVELPRATTSPSSGYDRGLPASCELSPFSGGTPPLPSKLVAKASEEIGLWREDVQRLRAELAKTYKSICTLQAVLWESPTARHLISPARSLQKWSPTRVRRTAKLPPSPLSKVSLAFCGSDAEADNESDTRRQSAMEKSWLAISSADTDGSESQAHERTELPTSCEASVETTMEGIPSRVHETSLRTSRGTGAGMNMLGTNYSSADSRSPTKGALLGNLGWPSALESGGLPAGKSETTAGPEAEQEKTAPAGILGFLQGLSSPPPNRKMSSEGLSRNAVESTDEQVEGDELQGAGDLRSCALNEEADTWHDASDKVLPRSIAFDGSPRRSTPPSWSTKDSPTRAKLGDTPSSQALPDVRSSVASIAAVHLPPLTSSYSTTPPALSIDCSPVRSPESSPPRNRILVDRSHNESEDPALSRRRSKLDIRMAPPTPFYEASEKEPRQTKNGVNRTPGAQPERELLSTFHQLASRPLPPVTTELLRKKASSRQGQNRISPRSESSQRASVTRRDPILKDERRVKWWDTVEEEDKENGGSGKKPKERSPRYSPKHMSATPSKSILKQGIPVGPRSLAHLRDMRLRKLQAQAAVGPKITGRAVRVKGRYI